MRIPKSQTHSPAAALLAAVTMVLAGCSLATRPAVDPPGPQPPRASDVLDQRLAEATTGLVFERDRVVVDPAQAGGAAGAGTVTELMAEGNQALAEGRRLEAVQAFSRAVLAATTEAEPYEGLGMALARVKRFRWAAACYLTALDQDPSRNQTRYAAANLLHATGRLDEAIPMWQEVVARDPEHGEAHARLAVGHFLRDELDTARYHLEQARALGAEVPSHMAAVLTSGELPRARVRTGDAAGAPDSSPPSLLIGPAVRIDSAGSGAEANEVSIAAADPTGAEAVAAWNDYRQSSVLRVGVAVTLDGGDTWSDLFVRPPAGHQSDWEGDPMTAYDHRTGTLWAGGVSYFISQGGLFVARKQATSATFEPSVMPYPTDDFVDKGWLGTGPIPGSPDSTRLYLGYYQFLQHSDDLGDTWSSPIGVGCCFGHLPRVGPDGELYIAFLDSNTYVHKLQRSFDGGTTVGAPQVLATRVDADVEGYSYPGQFRVWPFTYIAVDRTSGTVYAVWHDVTSTVGGNANVDLLFSRSTDDGATWSAPVVINGDGNPPGDQFFPWIEVDQWGRLHLFFLDTRNTPQNDTDARAWIDAYYSHSEDGGATWTEHRLSDAPFDSELSAIDFLGDYCGLAVAGERVYVSYLSTANGDPDIFAHTIIFPHEVLFEDGFESGDTSAWSVVLP